MHSVMKGLMKAMLPPRIFGLEPHLEIVLYKFASYIYIYVKQHN